MLKIQQEQQQQKSRGLEVVRYLKDARDRKERHSFLRVHESDEHYI